MASGLQHLPAGILSSPSHEAQMLRATSERWGWLPRGANSGWDRSL